MTGALTKEAIRVLQARFHSPSYNTDADKGWTFDFNWIVIVVKVDEVFGFIDITAEAFGSKRSTEVDNPVDMIEWIDERMERAESYKEAKEANEPKK